MNDSYTTTVSIVSFTSQLWPVYMAVMFGLAIWLFRRTRIAGSAVLMAGYGASLVAHSASRVVTIIAFQSFSLQLELPGELPGWYWQAEEFLGLVGVAANVIIAIGFAKLCAHLIRDHRKNA